MKDVVRFLAAWALLHESADEAWKAAVARGAGIAPDDFDRGPQAFVDGLAALVAEEKDRLKRQLGDGGGDDLGGPVDLGARLEAVAFELAELRGRIETLQASVDALAARRGG